MPVRYAGFCQSHSRRQFVKMSARRAGTGSDARQALVRIAQLYTRDGLTLYLGGGRIEMDRKEVEPAMRPNSQK